MDSPVNVIDAPTYAPAISAKGTITFCSRDRAGNKGMRGYAAKWKNDHYETPVLLPLNGDHEIFDPFVAPDGKTLYYSSSQTDGIIMIPINIPSLP